MATSLSKTYEPAAYEADIYALWEKSGAFAPTPPAANRPAYSVVVPPPNANGNLHIGHALTMALQDIAVRYHRMKGDSTLFIPGADHAGFETQVVYERHLAKEGKSRFDFTREELYDRIWEFVAQNRSNYTQQFRQLGASVDWEHFRFTLDEPVIQQAYRTFKKMWDEGLIYRGERLVNYCTFHGTAFADIEVVHEDESSHLWYICYPLTDGSGEVTVATTRPETMFGDTAVAVHPDDPRYATFVGKTIRLPLTERDIPIIADSFVDPAFGTGAVKITPAHDPNDYEAGERHDLPKITVIDHEGKLNDSVPEQFRGLSVEKGREAAVAALTAEGYVEKIEELIHSVGHCYKCGTIIQPLLRDQWFVTMKPLAQPAIAALKAGRIAFYPESKRSQLLTYLENLKDWNISRQIAWGIPIPAFQNVDNSDDWIYDERVHDSIITRDGKTYRRDPDVFDTWFSSGSWPYVTLGYPETEDFKRFYPLSLMETGFDILMPWVSRMLMLGLYTTGEIPFRTVYLHGLVLDAHGQKMSKSKGNVVNPIEIVDTYGADALRLGILSGQSAGSNQPFGEEKVIGARNFCNKLWNVARYIEDKVGDLTHSEAPQPASIADQWVLSKLQQSADSISLALEQYRFSDAADQVYHLIWDDVADWYIEASKPAPNLPLLAFVLENCLKLAHPFAPFVTETIWQTLPWQTDSLLMTSAWPTIPAGDAAAAEQFGRLQAVVTEIRTITSQLHISKLTLLHDNDPLLTEQGSLIAFLTRLEAVEAGAGHGLGLSTTAKPSWLEIDPETIKRYIADLQTRRTAAGQRAAQLRGRLGNESYRYKAPAALVAASQQELNEAEALVEHLTGELRRAEG